MQTITYQPALRPALPCIYGPLEYREQRDLYERIDGILRTSGLEQEFINLAVPDRKFDVVTAGAKRVDRFARMSVLALRSNIARRLMGLDHREFCVRLADSPLLQWFLSVGQVDAVKVFAKSSSDRFSRWVGEEAVRAINEKFTALLTESGESAPSVHFGLASPINGEGLVLDYKLYQDNPGDSTLVKPAIQRLVVEQNLALKNVWGDRGLWSKTNRNRRPGKRPRHETSPGGILKSGPPDFPVRQAA